MEVVLQSHAVRDVPSQAAVLWSLFKGVFMEVFAVESPFVSFQKRTIPP